MVEGDETFLKTILDEKNEMKKKNKILNTDSDNSEEDAG